MSWGIPREPRRIKGDPIKCLRDLVDHLDCGGWVFFNHKAYHPYAIRCWSLGMLQHYCRSGALIRAVINPKRKSLSAEQARSDWYEVRAMEARRAKRQMQVFLETVGARTEP